MRALKKHSLIIFACIHLCLLSWAQDVPVSPPLPDTTETTSPAPMMHPSPGRRSLFYARGGLSFFVAYNPTRTTMLYAPGVTVAPGIRILQNRDAALTLTVPLTLGWSRTNAFADLDLPAMLDLHLGSAAGNNQNLSLGLVAGAGVAYLYAENHHDGSMHVAGLRCHAGISFGKKNNDTRNLVLISYGESTTPSHDRVIGISFQLIGMNQ
jgi:hypothetical protein